MYISQIVSRLFSATPKRIQNWVQRILHKGILNTLVFYFSKKSILREKGWFDSQKRGAPVDQNGTPIPWYTYSMIDFLETRLTDEHYVFEYGGGYSTLWYAEEVGSVMAVEDSEEWTKIVSKKLPANSDIKYRQSKEKYTQEVVKYNEFDIIVIDGSHRSSCVEPALEAISHEGVIIWDDFERTSKKEYELFIKEGYSILPFYGLKPLRFTNTCTAIFYRDDNCLGI